MTKDEIKTEEIKNGSLKNILVLKSNQRDAFDSQDLQVIYKLIISRDKANDSGIVAAYKIRSKRGEGQKGGTATIKLMTDQNDILSQKPNTNNTSTGIVNNDNKQEKRNSVVMGEINLNLPPMKNGIPIVPEDKKSKQIGCYILGKKLGEGTFGKVKLATHIFTNEKVAIKILEKDRIIDVSDVERVSREIHILKLLRHSNIIQLYEIIETPKQLFLVMEYASGGELFDYIVANQRVKEKEAARFFQQIIAGIEYIHKLNIVHRDLKPENLLLNHDKSIKIVDFGLSNTYKKNELLKTACGSPCYAAPEMIAGKKYEGLGVDIWSCGVILYALLCGYLPFEDPNTANLYKKILAGEFTVPKTVSSDARDLLKNILNTDPQKRFTVDDIRNHAWCNQYRLPKTPEGIIVGYNKIPVDSAILSQLENFQYNLDHAQKCIDANKHNQVTTCYYLLLKKHIKAGGKSIADICSEEFDSTLLLPNKRPSKSKITKREQNVSFLLLAPHKDQFGSDLLNLEDEKENLSEKRARSSVLNSRKESRDQSLTKEAVQAVLLNNTAQLNFAASQKRQAQTLLMDDSKNSSNAPSCKESKRNSIQTNRLNFNVENGSIPNTTKPQQTNQNYLIDKGMMNNNSVNGYSHSNHQSIQQQIILQQQQQIQQQQQQIQQLSSNNINNQQIFTRQPIQQQLQYIISQNENNNNENTINRYNGTNGNNNYTKINASKQNEHTNNHLPLDTPSHNNNNATQLLVNASKTKKSKNNKAGGIPTILNNQKQINNENTFIQNYVQSQKKQSLQINTPDTFLNQSTKLTNNNNTNYGGKKQLPINNYLYSTGSCSRGLSVAKDNRDNLNKRKKNSKVKLDNDRGKSAEPFEHSYNNSHHINEIPQLISPIKQQQDTSFNLDCSILSLNHSLYDNNRFKRTNIHHQLNHNNNGNNNNNHNSNNSTYNKSKNNSNCNSNQSSNKRINEIAKQQQYNQDAVNSNQFYDHNLIGANQSNQRQSEYKKPSKSINNNNNQYVQQQNSQLNSNNNSQSYITSSQQHQQQQQQLLQQQQQQQQQPQQQQYLIGSCDNSRRGSSCSSNYNQNYHKVTTSSNRQQQKRQDMSLNSSCNASLNNSFTYKSNGNQQQFYPLNSTTNNKCRF